MASESLTNSSPPANYRDAHLKFVSNHTGTSVPEVLSAVAIPQLSLLFQLLLVMCPTLLNRNLGTRFVIEFLLITLPQMALCTVLSDSAMIIGYALFCLCFFLSSCVAAKALRLESLSVEDMQPESTGGTCHYLTTFRGGLLVLTVICILAVDFQIFPRRFAKVETYGYGLMDLGIGSFIVINAIVSYEARGIRLTLKKQLQHTIESSIPLLALGLSRILAVRASGYHERVSEGGLHWNFFFTLALTKMLATLLFMVINPKYSIVIAVAIISIYQDLLTKRGLSAILLDDGPSRHSGIWYYVDVNKSGICSCFGYLSIYFTAVSLGRYLLTIRRATGRDWTNVLQQLFIISCILFATLWISHHYVEPASRRLANLTYTIWVISFTTVFLTTSIASDVVPIIFKQLRSTAILQRKTLKTSKRESGSFTKLEDVARTSLLLHAANYNGLIYFLLSNILTGIVNLTMETIHAPPLTAWCVLTLYMLLTSALVVYMDVRKVKRFKKTHGPDFVENYDSSFEDSEPKCDYCLLTAMCNPSGKSEELLICKDCNAKAHPSCMDYSVELAMRSRMSPWQCIDCKTCYICQDSEDADSMLFCDSCDKGYHMGCHRPKILEKPVGKWVCQRCKEEIGISETSSSNDSIYGVNITVIPSKKTYKTNSAVDSSEVGPSKCTVDGASGLPTPCDSPVPDAQQNKHPYGTLFGIKLNSFLENKGTLSLTTIPDAINWSIEDVEKHLSSVGFSDQAKSFKEQEIDGRSLLLMKRNDVLTGLSLKLGPALKIHSYVRQLQLKHLDDLTNI